MQKKQPIKRRPPLNEVDASNAEILRRREERIEAKRPILPDLELGLVKEDEPAPATATEFMDQFDKKAFGDGREATITKIIYGPIRWLTTPRHSAKRSNATDARTSPRCTAKRSWRKASARCPTA